ncbi:MAG: hypothetical protein CYPHOPRED_003854 [Cyphobasidiales sp. Tagirdzhanova-0007]|nr:MAG: hypothetical protein CYPHOPRED_003854 [Cyphobasidiales sp. Tagirdzhanova-0007]
MVDFVTLIIFRYISPKSLEILWEHDSAAESVAAYHVNASFVRRISKLKCSLVDLDLTYIIYIIVAAANTLEQLISNQDWEPSIGRCVTHADETHFLPKLRVLRLRYHSHQFDPFASEITRASPGLLRLELEDCITDDTLKIILNGAAPSLKELLILQKSGPHTVDLRSACPALESICLIAQECQLPVILTGMVLKRVVINLPFRAF